MQAKTFSQKFSLILMGLAVLMLSSCTIYRKVPPHQYYLAKNTFEVKGDGLNKIEKEALKLRMASQLEDSSQLKSKSALFLFTVIRKPPKFDTGWAALSARNIQSSMYHLGFYNAKAFYQADTVGKKVKVNYVANMGKPTRIDTVAYIISNDTIKNIVNQSLNKSLLKVGEPISKAIVLGEIGRIVDTLRNNGFYKFTGADLRVRGDTTIEALTKIGEDPFEDILLLQEAQKKRDSPTIKLGVLLNTTDAARLTQYKIRNIYVLPDMWPGDNFENSGELIERKNRSFTIRNHQRLFRTQFLRRNITFHSGEIFSQEKYNQTLNNLARAGVWSSTALRIIDVPDSNLVDIVAELIASPKFTFEAGLEGSYSSVSSTTNALGGNLWGLSANFSLTNKNIGKEAIKMTHSFRAGVELNNRFRTKTSSRINSTEFSYMNSILIPKLVSPIKKLNTKFASSSETYINSGISFSNRLDLFSLQNARIAYGFTIKGKKDRIWNVRPLFAEFSYLYNQKDSFKNILANNPYLNYAYNTSFVMGMGIGYSSVYRNPKHILSTSKERSFKANFEESGLTWGLLPIAEKYKRHYIKTDLEYKYTVNFLKTSMVFRLFTGIGYPINKRDTTLPFFKQYFGGGANSMRGWPVRGIGLGRQPLASISNNRFNNRTGDMQIEGNFEYRYDIARIIPNTLTLRGALFADAGNIWNLKNSKPDGSTDSAQFKIKNIYKEIGLSAGTGFRLDFNYFIVRFDFGFRFKRPETSDINNGWKVPDIGLDDAIKKLFSTADQYRRWRYENFNFTIGISYPF